VVQVDPIKTTLKPTGTKRLKLNCDELLSTFAFNFNLRRYDMLRRRALEGAPYCHNDGKGVHSSTSQLNLNRF